MKECFSSSDRAVGVSVTKLDWERLLKPDHEIIYFFKVLKVKHTWLT